jgi:CBS domain containing-hemolysin-like protein
VKRKALAGEEAETDTIRLTVLDADDRRIGKVRIARWAEKPSESEE